MSSFHKNHGPMTSGGCGSTSQLTITNPTGSPPAQTTRYHGLAWGYPAACASALRTDLTNRSYAQRQDRLAVLVGDLAEDHSHGVNLSARRRPRRRHGGCRSCPKGEICGTSGRTLLTL